MEKKKNGNNYSNVFVTLTNNQDNLLSINNGSASWVLSPEDKWCGINKYVNETHDHELRVKIRV